MFTDSAFQQWAQQFTGGSEASSPGIDLKAYWDQLSDEDRWGLLGNGYVMNAGDPAQREWTERMGIPEDRRFGTFYVGRGNAENTVNGINRYNDPSRVFQGDGFHVENSENWTPEYSDYSQGDNLLNRFLISAAAIVAGGSAFNYFGGAGLGTEAGMDAASAAEWFGGTGAADAPSAGLFGSEAAGQTPGLFGEGAMPGWGAEGGASPGLGNYAPVRDISTQAASSGRGPLASLLSGNFGEAASGLGTWAMNNPLQAYGAVQTLGGLFGGGGDGGGSPGGAPNGSWTPSGNRPKMQRPQWQPNPYLQQQIQRYGGL